jgi:membrane fusion protein (multidrug efflux system)
MSMKIMHHSPARARRGPRQGHATARAAAPRGYALGAGLLAITLGVAGCKSETPPASAAPPEVRVAEATAQSISLTREWVGRAEAYRQVEIRPQVEGTLWKRHFVEGTNLRKGDRMYSIDPRPFEAKVKQAEASVASAAAALLKAQQKLARVLPLVKDHALSEQDGDNSIADEREAAANLAQAKANLELALVNLSYTEIVATQDGRVARTLVQEGALVRNETLLTVIDRIDPVYVTFNVTDKEQLAFRKAQETGVVKALPPRAMVVRVKLPDDSMYPATGTLDFAGVIINKETGTFAARAVFPNPDSVLLPGMFCRVEVDLGVAPNALLIPQQAVVTAVNDHYVFVVNSKNEIERRLIVVGDWHGSDWIIRQGLAAGERVVVGDLSKVHAGLTVRPVAAAPGAAPAARPVPAAAPKAPGAS